jgi:late competence protein required for DNA uptake (superfamily II DNA/RNA helicase)
MVAHAASCLRERRSTVKQIFITTDQLSKCTELAEVLETVFSDCEIRIVVGEGLKTVHEKTAGVFTSSIQSH